MLTSQNCWQLWETMPLQLNIRHVCDISYRAEWSRPARAHRRQVPTHRQLKTQRAASLWHPSQVVSEGSRTASPNKPEVPAGLRSSTPRGAPMSFTGSQSKWKWRWPGCACRARARPNRSRMDTQVPSSQAGCRGHRNLASTGLRHAPPVADNFRRTQITD